MRAKQQRNLPFDGKREQDRLDTIERLFGNDKRVKVAARYFDYDEATETARSASQPLGVCDEGCKHQGTLGGG